MSDSLTVTQRYLSYAEAASYVGCSTATLQRWRERGDLPVHKVGRLVRFAIEDLDAVLRRGSSVDGD